MISLISRVKSVLKDIGAAPRKRLGQNFMVHAPDINFIADCLAIQNGETVLEIGPGLGFLTEALLARGAKVVAVEKDLAYGDYLKRQFSSQDLRVLTQDILSFRISQDLPGEAALQIVGNIPYNITSQLLEWLIREKEWVKRAVFTMQKEVAERLAAVPGTKAWGALTVFVQLNARVRTLKTVSSVSFFPEPGVDSAVVELDFSKGPLFPVKDPQKLSRIVRGAFQKRRKTLLNALSQAEEGSQKNELRALFLRLSIDPMRRPETLSIPEWIALADAL